MLRLIVALTVVVAMAVSALGFAASFQVNYGVEEMQNISSGDHEVGACTNGGTVKVDLTVDDYDAALHDFVVGKIKIDASSNCGNDFVMVELITRGGASLAGPFSATLDDYGTATIDVVSNAIPVGKVTSLQVAIRSHEGLP